jgi:hypothetical protein
MVTLCPCWVISTVGQEEMFHITEAINKNSNHVRCKYLLLLFSLNTYVIQQTQITQTEIDIFEFMKIHDVEHEK